MPESHETHQFFLLDRMTESVRAVAREPGFSREVRARESRKPEALAGDAAVLQKIASLIAYSQNAPADGVGRMLEGGGFERAFEGFDVARVAAMDPEAVIASHWSQIRVIRFKKKIRAIVDAAGALVRLRKRGLTVPDLLAKIPKELADSAAIDTFWSEFHAVRGQLLGVQMPFLQSPVTLLHLLLELGYPCLKPDLIVLKAAAELGLVRAKAGEREKLALVRLLQEYAVHRKMPMAVLDFHYLCYGGQTWARQFVIREPVRVTETGL